MIDQQSVSKFNEKKNFRESVRAYGMKWSGISGYFKVGVVALAAIMAVMI